MDAEFKCARGGIADECDIEGSRCSLWEWLIDVNMHIVCKSR